MLIPGRNGDRLKGLPNCLLLNFGNCMLFQISVGSSPCCLCLWKSSAELFCGGAGSIADWRALADLRCHKAQLDSDALKCFVACFREFGWRINFTFVMNRWQRLQFLRGRDYIRHANSSQTSQQQNLLSKAAQPQMGRDVFGFESQFCQRSARPHPVIDAAVFVHLKAIFSYLLSNFHY